MRILHFIFYPAAALLVIYFAYRGHQSELAYRAVVARYDSLADVREPAPFTTTNNNQAAIMPPTLDSATTISFVDTFYAYGRVEAGPKYKTSFHFLNTGKNPLVISKAVGSCGCTVPVWPEEPIPPGKGGDITVEFDSKGRVGHQLKTIAVTANTQPSVNMLTITCDPYIKK